MIFLFSYLRYSAMHGNDLMGPAALVVPFVACGDLSGLAQQQGDVDADNEVRDVDAPDYQYAYRPAVLVPSDPNYQTYQQRVAAAAGSK